MLVCSIQSCLDLRIPRSARIESSADRKLSATPAQACGAGLLVLSRRGLTDLSADLGELSFDMVSQKGLGGRTPAMIPHRLWPDRCPALSTVGIERKKRLRDELVDTAYS
ncbi:uncharacterized protein PADG_11119 [Paracoccidioides brasiliensis Pb18]|uniref:Uncharacterized protein n=2 Tax=Paracoccidioides brasiliensis TaxID=121759 RepID=A0A0A0HZ87_PARBD|nr:uncharacterized protein PADG_11119 [Paracoccidioides brasiliensis Pb18]KGM92665.1 hypothetical protein PADG_11119 [Paracoccidioides brasiliensis Pb18]ODH31997.1 hypothetical protein ACO22_03425 [Paracoccidioides brasiliensis]ODH53470.1 hypothetical protein GX48_00301 [Paracoccidioides brasiliensis]